MLTKKQFDILQELIICNGKCSQRGLAEKLSISIGTVNKAISELSSTGYLKNKNITEKGLDALEPYRVKRAVFMAAGFGSRMVPITVNTPKPLVRVNGTRIIDTLLDAVTAVGIDEIYIVRGYLAEEFDQLLKKYPTIKFIENPDYNESNNISSVSVAGDKLSNAYLLESDLLLMNKNLITKYQYNSNYLGVPTKRTDDWCFITQNDVIKKLQIGGRDCYHMFGISYWTEKDGLKLSQDVKEVFSSPGGKERYIDQVPLEYHKANYTVHVRKCSFSDIKEIDSFNELKAIDPLYSVT